MVERTKYERNGWRDYEKLVMYRLDELDDKLAKRDQEIFGRLIALEKCVAGLKVFVRIKAGLWGGFGAFAAMITAAAAWAMFFQGIGIGG